MSLESQPPLNVSCEVHDGVLTVPHSVPGYYVFQDGQRTLVLNRKEGARLRINDEVELVVLEASPGAVKLGVCTASDDSGDHPPREA